MALSEALCMLHQAMHDTSSPAAAKVIKTDQNNHQNHGSNWFFVFYCSYCDVLHNDTDISRMVGRQKVVGSFISLLFPPKELVVDFGLDSLTCRFP